jgi:hypothetical protein
MSELLSLRREVTALRKKADQTRVLETQNAMLHLSVAKAEQENLTLKRAVVILQRRLRDLELETVEKATLISACEGSMQAARSSSPLLPHHLQPPQGLSPSIGRSVSSGRSRLNGSSFSRDGSSPVLLRMAREVSPQLRRSSRSPTPPHQEHQQTAALTHFTIAQLQAARRQGADSAPMKSLLPLSTNVALGSSSSLLFTPPKNVVVAAAACVPKSHGASPSPSPSPLNSQSIRHQHHQNPATFRHTVEEAAAVFSGLAAATAQHRQRDAEDAHEDFGAVEVSAISSLFSPVSVRRHQQQMQLNASPSTATLGGTPVSPRTIVPSPQPRDHSPQHRPWMSPPKPAAERRSSSLPSAPSRVSLTNAARPPTAPFIHTGSSSDRLQRGRSLVARSGSSPAVSRSSSIASSNGGDMSIDEELNEGIQRKLASLTFI